jgi:hypothetical protein
VPYLGSALKTISRLPAESARLGDDMLTAEGVIGKIVSFIVDKTIGKISTLPFDKRRKACRSLTKLYYSVQALDDVTENFPGDTRSISRLRECCSGGSCTE